MYSAKDYNKDSIQLLPVLSDIRVKRHNHEDYHSRKNLIASCLAT